MTSLRMNVLQQLLPSHNTACLRHRWCAHSRSTGGIQAYRCRYHYHALPLRGPYRIPFGCLWLQPSCTRRRWDLSRRPLASTWPIMIRHVRRRPCPAHQYLTWCRWFWFRERRGLCYSALSCHRCRHKLWTGGGSPGYPSVTYPRSPQCRRRSHRFLCSMMQLGHMRIRSGVR